MIPLQLMAQRPKNLYVVYGWRVDDSIRNNMMTDKGADAKEMGISLTMTADGKHAFVGLHLQTLDIREGQEYVGMPHLTIKEQDSVEVSVKKLEIPVVGQPFLYIVAG
jgi:hypothetical protein